MSSSPPTNAGIIINPHAGAHRRVPPEVRTALAEKALAVCGITGKIAFTQAVGSAGKLARAMVVDGATTLVAWGGDGTINEVACVAVACGVPLGIVPGGSGNGLARELGIEYRPADALRTAMAGRERWIDTGTLNGRLFVNAAGMGLDAYLAGIFSRLVRRGPMAYFTVGLRELLAYQPAEYAVRTGDMSFSRTALLVTVANGRQYGSGALIAPRAELDDGKLDLVLLPALSPLPLLWHARRLFTGTVDRVPGVQTIQVTTVQLDAEGSIPFHVDGEVFSGRGPFEVTVRPRTLRVRVPDAGSRRWEDRSPRTAP